MTDYSLLINVFVSFKTPLVVNIEITYVANIPNFPPPFFMLSLPPMKEFFSWIYKFLLRQLSHSPWFLCCFFGLYLTLIRKSSFSFKQVTIFLRHFKVCLSIRLKSYFSSITRSLFASVKSKSMFILRHFYGVPLLVKKILF